MLVVLFVSENSTTRVTRLHLGQSREQNTSVDTLQQKVVKGHDMGQHIVCYIFVLVVFAYCIYVLSDHSNN